MKIVIVGACPNSAALILPTLCTLHARRSITRVSHGCADSWVLTVETWAWERRIRTVCYPANWDLYGRDAAEYRDQAMLNERRPDLLIAMGAGVQVGRMKMRALLKNIPVVIPGFESTKEALSHPAKFAPLRILRAAASLSRRAQHNWPTQGAQS